MCKMKPMDYIKQCGIEIILKMCGYNLRAVRNRLKRNCDSKNINTVMPKFKQYLKKNQIFDKALMNEFKDMVNIYFGGYYDEQ